MESRKHRDGLTRRDFLRRAAAGAAATVGAASGLGIALPEMASGWAATPGSMKRRTLGRTELKVSELGLGTIKTNSAAVIHRALDLGINYFDTAECYQGGNSEIRLGQALKGRRDKAVVATKWHISQGSKPGDLLASLDESLQRLGMDYVELIQIHGARNAAQAESDVVWEAFTEARKAGKARFNGLSTHSHQVEVMQAAVKCGRYDAVLPSHNALTADTTGPAIAQAHAAGVGVIVMKGLAPAHQGKDNQALAGLRGSLYQRSIQWVLKDPSVATVIVDMPTFEELEEDVAAVTHPPTAAALDEFERSVRQASAGTCRLCGACTGQCPAGVQVADIMRYQLYHDGYGDRARAGELYRALPASASAAACLACGECRVVCPWGIAVRPRLEKLHGLLV